MKTSNEKINKLIITVIAVAIAILGVATLSYHQSLLASEQCSQPAYFSSVDGKVWVTEADGKCLAERGHLMGVWVLAVSIIISIGLVSVITLLILKRGKSKKR